MLLIPLTEANRPHQHPGFWICPTHPGPSYGTLSLWLKDWVSLLTLALLQRGLITLRSLSSPQWITESFEVWGIEGRLPVAGVQEDRPASVALFSGSNLASPGSWPDITVNLEIFVRISYLLLLCFWACLSWYTQAVVIFWPAIRFFIPSSAL